MFVNRSKEIQRIRTTLELEKSNLIVVYGRRRCGKSTLIKKLLTDKNIYFSADLREKSLQIEAFANNIEKIKVGFSKIRYPGWDGLSSVVGNSRAS